MRTGGDTGRRARNPRSGRAGTAHGPTRFLPPRPLPFEWPSSTAASCAPAVGPMPVLQSSTSASMTFAFLENPLGNPGEATGQKFFREEITERVGDMGAIRIALVQFA